MGASLATGHAGPLPTLGQCLGWLSGGSWGAVASFVTIYALAVLAMLPAGFLALVAGYAFGFWAGMGWVLLAHALGSWVGFALGRHALREAVRARLGRFPRLEAVYRAVDQDSLWGLLLLRLVPVLPCGAVNYALSLTRVSWRRYGLTAAAGALPGSLVLVYAGQAASSWAEVLAAPGGARPMRALLWGVGCLSALGLAWRWWRRPAQNIPHDREIDPKSPTCACQAERIRHTPTFFSGS